MAEIVTSEQKSAEKSFEVVSKEEGIVSNIDWNSLSSYLKSLFKDVDRSQLGIEFHKFVGESVNKGNILASVYGVNPNYNDISNNKKKTDYKYYDVKEDTNANTDNEKNIKKEKVFINNLEQKIISSIEINNVRDITRDPFYGIELLRTISIKSASNNDIDVTNSCITGLFRILVYVLNQDVFGIPFTIKIKIQ